ncbi:hypothetical protein [Flavobacterium sp. MK4S-17]|uniref:hypothetical protein n=1 Tax=Flavobacterium sp. MK4S-17 TaxID=2543737 RepID=UPI0013597755|nr:hypothetical protein [Flavobacterium sp. MK4S-17]
MFEAILLIGIPVLLLVYLLIRFIKSETAEIIELRIQDKAGDLKLSPGEAVRLVARPDKRVVEVFSDTEGYKENKLGVIKNYNIFKHVLIEGTVARIYSVYKGGILLLLLDSKYKPELL